MEPLKLYLVHDVDDIAWTQSLLPRLQQEVDKAAQIAKLDAEDTPQVKSCEGIASIPSPRGMDPLSLVLLVLPSRQFTSAEQMAIEKFLGEVRAATGTNDVRLIPLAMDSQRNVPPPPLGEYVSAKLYDPAAAGAGTGVGATELRALVNRVLNLLCLRVAGEDRRVFISYRQKDGMPVARAVEEALTKLDYNVWRDDRPDRDGSPNIGPGTKAQQTIQDAIARQGLVVLIDTREAQYSPWVKEEVRLAVGLLLPIVPLVVEDVGETSRPRPGGRFPSLQYLGLEARPATKANYSPGDVNDQFVEEILIPAMTSALLENLRYRRRLVAGAKEAFESLGFAWADITGHALLFRAEVAQPHPLTPELYLRLLVQCSPFSGLLTESIDSLCDLFRSNGVPPSQYAVLVHDSVANVLEKERSLKYCGGHVMALAPGEIRQVFAPLLAAARGGTV